MRCAPDWACGSSRAPPPKNHLTGVCESPDTVVRCSAGTDRRLCDVDPEIRLVLRDTGPARRTRTDDAANHGLARSLGDLASLGVLELPSGVVTFVFTDIEGSTRLFRRLGDAYPPLLERHNRLLRAAWDRHGGREVKTEGDAFFVAFADTGAAIAACADAQRSLQSEPWPRDGSVRVRMGVHAGLAYPRDGDYVAFAVHQAARVVSAADGGQIVVSEHAAALAGPVAGVTLLPAGRFRLRDFDEPVELFNAMGDGRVSSTPRCVPCRPTATTWCGPALA